MNTLNKRKFSRYECFVPVDYSDQNDRFYRDFAVNISEQGVFISSPNLLKTGDHIRIIFPGTELESPTTKIPGVIIRTNKGGFAVKFQFHSNEPNTTTDLVRHISSRP